jgi:TonB family protein
MALDPVNAANLLRYFGQVLVVIASAEIGLRAIRPASARLRLIFWRLAITCCLLLPLLPVARIIDPAPPARTPAAASAAASSVAAPTDLVSRVRSGLLPAAEGAAAFLPWLLLAGAAARAAWLGVGFVALRRLRAASRELDFSPAASADALDVQSLIALKEQLAPRAELRTHDSVTQPVTFGLLRPIILLPPRIVDLPIDAQRAIICHELLHIARRDWAWTLLDEAIRTALWWHPAIWWALAQVHLHREQTIDARVVAITAARQPYMRALLLFADAAPAPVAVPFIRRRHLAARLRQLAQHANHRQEAPMSRRSRLRLTSAITALTAILAIASWASVTALPLHGLPLHDPRLQDPQAMQRPQQEWDKAFRLSGEHPPKILAKPNPEYPDDAKADRVEGDVGVEMLIDTDGSVVDVRVIKSIPKLDQATMDAARKWKFEPVVIDDVRVQAKVKVVIRFKLK